MISLTREKIIYFIAYIFFGLTICLPLTMSVISNTLIQLPLAQVAGLVLIFLTLFFFITTNKVTIIGSSIFITVLALVIYLDYCLSKPKDSFVYSVINFFNGAYQAVLGYIPYSQDYSIVLVALIVLMLSLYFCIFYKVIFSYFALLVAGIGVYAINILTGFFVADIHFFIFLIAILALFLRQLNISGNKKSGKNGKSIVYSLIVTPVCIMCVFTAGFMPIPGQKDLGLLREALSKPYEVMSDVLYLAFNPKYFMFQTTGFSGGAKTSLGGNVLQNDAYVMNVTTDSPVYLTGDIKTIYNGQDWGKTNVSQLSDLTPIDKTSPNLDSLEHFFGLSISLSLLSAKGSAKRTSENTMLDFKNVKLDLSSSIAYPQMFVEGRPYLMEPTVNVFAKKKLSVNVGIKRTFSMFVPTTIDSINYDGNVLLKDDGATVSNELIKTNGGYDIEYFDFQDDEFFDPDYFLKSNGIYKSLQEDMKIHPYLYFDGFKIDGRPYYYKDLLPELINYSDYVYENYLNLPENLPSRVRDLAEGITGAETTDYQKLLAIQEYLKNYEYTLSPGALPPDADFVDHFLFEGQKGYCTYFASAFAVLARCVGIPTRYMEGFTIAGDDVSEGTYLVTNKMAHSWPEAYLEGYGWILLDPTPSDAIGNYEPQVTEAFNYGNMPMDRQINEYMNPARDNGNEPSPTNRPSTGGTNKIYTPKSLWFYMRLTGLICAVAFLIYMLIYSLVKKSRLKMAEKAGYDQLALYYFNEFYRYLIFFGDKREDWETLIQYGRRLSNRELYKHSTFRAIEDPEYMLKVTEIVSKASYSGKNLTKEDVRVIMNAYDLLRKKYIFSTGFVKRIYFSYVLRSVY